MKIFISWSGKYTKEVAEAIKDWIKPVLQGIEDVFFSPDIEKGKRGFEKISEALFDSAVGIICLTKENIHSEWINFEAGALSNIKNSNVYTLLLDAKPSDIDPHSPLTMFQHTLFEKDDFFKIIESVNSKITIPLEGTVLRTIFEKWWPDLQERISAIKTPITSESLKTDADQESIESRLEKDRDILEELLTISRRLDNATTSRDSDKWRMSTDLEEAVRYRQYLENLIQMQFQELTKPATEVEMERWIEGYVKDDPSKIDQLRIYSRDVRYADRDFIMPILYGASAVTVLVESGVRVFKGSNIGHSTILYLDGFRREGLS